jgi:hypothetical protein
MKSKAHIYILKKDSQLFREGDILESYTSPNARKEMIQVTNREIYRINPMNRGPESKKEMIALSDLIHLDTLTD